MINVMTKRERHFGNYRIFYISEKDDKYASYIEVKDSTEKLPNWMQLSSLVTWPPYRRKGYASAVLDAAYQYALKQNKGVYLYVEIDNDEAISLYKKKGFEILCPYSVKKFYQSQDYFHFYIMAKNESRNTQDLFEYFYKMDLEANPDGSFKR